MRAVIDTNVVISAFLSPAGTPSQVLNAWRLDAFELVVSESILIEYQKALSYESIRARHDMDAEDIAQVVEGFRHFAILVEVNEQAQVIVRDPEDNKFLECALAGEATYIVSGDSHLLELKEYRGIQILSPAVFLAALGEL